MAKLAVDKFRVGDDESRIFLGITVRDSKQNPDEISNPFVFLDGTEFDDDDYSYQWVDNFSSHSSGRNCAILWTDGNIYNVRCDENGKALCYMGCPKSKDKSEDENSVNSRSKRSCANLQLFALFAAASVFNALHALAGPVI